MPQHDLARTRRCPDCDGFPVVAITTGVRRRDGSRATVFVTCPMCRPIDHAKPIALARAGR